MASESLAGFGADSDGAATGIDGSCAGNHHSDQGVQYACGDYTDLLRQQGVQISEEVDLSEYEYFHDAYRSTGRFLDEVYTLKHIHSALGYLTPAEYEANWLAHQPELVQE